MLIFKATETVFLHIEQNKCIVMLGELMIRLTRETITLRIYPGDPLIISSLIDITFRMARMSPFINLEDNIYLAGERLRFGVATCIYESNFSGRCLW